jgi:hypothetical protein
MNSVALRDDTSFKGVDFPSFQAALHNFDVYMQARATPIIT